MLEAALLLAWSAVEAGGRKALAAEGVVDERAVTGSGVHQQTVFHGIVSRDEHELMSLRAYRNAIAHGLEVEDFDDAVVREVIDAARRMAETASASPV